MTKGSVHSIPLISKQVKGLDFLGAWFRASFKMFRLPPLLLFF
jgi:hypothetical protein